MLLIFSFILLWPKDACGQRYDFNFSKFVKTCFVASHMIYLENVPCILSEEWAFCCCWIFCICLLYICPVGLWCYSSPSDLLSGCSIPLLKWILKSPTSFVLLFRHSILSDCFIYLSSDIRNKYIYNYHVFLVNWPF